MDNVIENDWPLYRKNLTARTHRTKNWNRLMTAFLLKYKLRIRNNKPY